jgi:dipeptidyl-peptidase-4
MNASRDSHRIILLSLACIVGGSMTARSQGTKADYERAAQLSQRTRNKVTRTAVRPHWSADGNLFWYKNDLPDGATEFVVVDAAKGVRRPAFDHGKMAGLLSKVTGKPQKADRLPIERLQIENDGTIRLLADGKTFRYDEKVGDLKPSDPLAPDVLCAVGQAIRSGNRRRQQPPRRVSPDGKWDVHFEENQLRLKELPSGKVTALDVEILGREFYEPDIYWSPDSSHFVAIHHTKGDDRKVYLIESSPRSELQPKLDSYDYLKPGDKIPIRKPHLFSVATRKKIPIKDNLFANPWDINDVRWLPDSSRFTFLYNQRGHQVLRVVSVDTKGEASTVVEETSSTFIDYSNKTFAHPIETSNHLIWMSERSGWNHLTMIDVLTGKVEHPITRGDWLVLGVERVDPDKKQIWFRAGGIHPGQDPYHVHFARVNFDGTGLTVLTEGDGTHQVAYSPDGRFLIDTYSRVDMPPVTELRRTDDGTLVCGLERADWSKLLATGWKPPERFVAKGRDGKTDIHGIVARPTNYDSTKKYPVIEQIYAGPQGAFVPKRFAPFHGIQALAEIGFVVVQIDGMGTNWRSKAFHDVASKNLGDAGFPDRILWMKALAAKDPGLDLSRVGIYGGSAGGQNAMGAVLFHPEFYKAAVADCGCHDNRMDKIWWNEAWMGWPIGPHYAEQSNVTNAHKLTGKLLLFVGELDRNVDPASTMQVVNSLIKADKDFELVVIPGGGHGAGGGPYGERRKRDFFVRNLLGVEPRR